MQIHTDFHSHISRTSAQEMARAAQERGIHMLGLSEHIFQMHEGRTPLQHMPLEGGMQSIATYLKAIQQARQAIPIELCAGLEVDFIPAKNEPIQAALQGYPWDFLIGSIHQVDDLRFESSAVSFTREQGEAAWLRYFQLLRAAVASGYFSLVSHPVRMRARNPHLPATFDDELEQLAAEATQHNVALEVNGFDTLTYPSLVRRLVRACAKHKTPISVGSDAHYPRELARAHQQSEAILHEVGIHSMRFWRQRIPEEYTI